MADKLTVVKRIYSKKPNVITTEDIVNIVMTTVEVINEVEVLELRDVLTHVLTEDEAVSMDPDGSKIKPGTLQITWEAMVEED